MGGRAGGTSGGRGAGGGGVDVVVISPEPWSLPFDDGAGRTLLTQQHDDVDVSGEPGRPFGGTVLADGELA